MTIPILATVIRIFWLLVEYPYVRRYHVRPAKDWDKNSAHLWNAAALIELGGMVLGFSGIGRINTSTNVIAVSGLLLMIAGTTLRWIAIRTLGKYFTGVVLIKNDHRLITTGLYKHLRHPAYTGALMAHLGLGLCFSNWFSLCLSSIPYLVAAFYRMRVEERALAEAFGREYVDYSKATCRLVPGLY
jgi:protein-S-isoprenylcysteine O-methyltransferase Ste14